MIASRKTYLRLLFPCVMPGRRRIWAEATRDAGAPIGLQPRVVWSTPCGTPGARSTRDNRTATRDAWLPDPDRSGPPESTPCP